MILPAMLIDIQHPVVTSHVEARTLLVALNGVAERSEPVRQLYDLAVPLLNGEARWDLPPATGWVLTLVLPSPDRIGLEGFITCARLVSVAMALIAIACVYWAGFSVGGLRTAGYAAAVCATGPLLLTEARFATPTIHFAAWGMLSIAAALWALRPLRPTPSLWRQAIGWCLCGLAMGVAILTIGPSALLAVALPVLFLTLLCPDRTSHVLGLLAALLLAALVVLPWATIVRQHDPDAWPIELVRWVALAWIEPAQLPGTWTLMLLALVASLLPWTLWILAAIVQPFSTSSRGVRVKLFLGWGWFLVSGVIYLLSPPELRRPFLVMTAAAGAVLIAEVFTQYVDLAASGRLARFWRWLRWVHLLGLCTLSIVIPLLVTRPEWFTRWGFTAAPLANFGWSFAGPLMMALLAVVIYTLLPRMADLPGRSLAFWTLWAAALLTAMSIPWARAPIHHSDLPAQAALLRTMTGQHNLYWLGAQNDDPAESNPVLLLYGPRTIHVLTAGDISSLTQEHSEFFLLSPASNPTPPGGLDASPVANQPVPGYTLQRVHATPQQAPPTQP